MQQARYRAFISYSHRDTQWATWLHRSLEAYRPPKHLIGQPTARGPVPNRLAPIFRDREELPSATDLGRVINEALEQSACQIVICSPAAARSKWVNEEILAFKRLGREHLVYCLIVAGEPNASDIPGSEDQECFPLAVRYQLAADGTLSDRRAEPIAADARPAKDGKSNAKIKLIAGLLGVGFDALKQRELHRRQRRLVAIAAASIAGMIVTSALAVAALLARAEAFDQRARAQAEAETSRQVTTFLVDIFKVSDPSEALGNTVTAREILDRGARRIDVELGNQPAIQSTLLDTMGTVYESLGLYDDAKSLLERGLATRRQVFGERAAEVARSNAHIGLVLGAQGQYEDAVRHYTEAIDALRASADTPPDEIALAMFGLSDVRALQGDFAEAERLLREAIAIQSANGAESLDLAHSVDALGLALVNLGRYDEAEPQLRRAVAMFRKLVPSGIHPDLDDGLNDLAFFLYEAGRYEETEALFRESLDINLRLLGERHPDIATSMNNLAFVLQDEGDLDGAQQLYEQALDIRRESLGETHPLTAQSLNNLAFLYHERGDAQRALDLSRQAVATYRRAYPGDHPELAHGLENLAAWLVESRAFDEARPLLDEALAMNLRLLPSDHPDVAITRSGMAVLLLDTGSAGEALELASSARSTLEKALGPDHWRTAWARVLEGAALTALERFAAAEPALLEGYRTLRTAAGARPTQTAAASRYLADLYLASGHPEKADPYLALRTGSESP